MRAGICPSVPLARNGRRSGAHVSQFAGTQSTFALRKIPKGPNVRGPHRATAKFRENESRESLRRDRRSSSFLAAMAQSERYRALEEVDRRCSAAFVAKDLQSRDKSA